MVQMPRWVRRTLLALAVGALAYTEFLVVTLKLPLLEILALAAIPAAGAAVLFYREGPKTSPISCENVLRAMLAAFYKERAGRYRANVMVPDRRRRLLRISFAYNMDGHLDRHTRMPVGAGCAGHCFRSGNIETFDFTGMTHAALGVDTRKIPVWAELRSIISFPIKQDNGKVVAVLSIDSSEAMETTAFRDSETHKAIGLYAELVFPFIEGE
ncbi:MAG: hypothetical protein ACHQ2Y_00035 [Candidatus Lutacidiplasmatales archaeon]